MRGVSLAGRDELVSSTSQRRDKLVPSTHLRQYDGYRLLRVSKRETSSVLGAWIEIDAAVVADADHTCELARRHGVHEVCGGGPVEGHPPLLVQRVISTPSRASCAFGNRP